MLIKLDFKLIYFYIMHLDLNVFHREILAIFKDNEKYNFHLNHTYYLNLIDPYGHVLVSIPFELISLLDNENNIENLYDDIYPKLMEYLTFYAKYNPSFFIFYLSAKSRNYISLQEMICIRKAMEN